MTLQRKLGTTVRMLALVVTAMAVMAAVGPSAGQADQVIADDLIVVGSACLGFDCQNEQAFSFTTFMLQENNMRIFFNDTSFTAAFPKNDWEIITNDANNGGTSFLGFADRGAGVVSVSGQGFCEGGTNHGLVCGDGTGANCAGVCVGGTFDGQPCAPDPNFCSDAGGTCVDAGECIPPGAIIFRIEAGGPENSLVIDSAGNVHIAGDLTVEGTLDGRASELEELEDEVEELEDEVEELRAEIEAIKSFPAIRNFLERD
ncbi:MAG: hypothetical protein ACE5GX_00445 [Thermoanaerobaculia bacterium]